MYYKYHNSWNHNTNSCWSFKSIIQDRINKGILKFLEKKEAMVIDKDPFPPAASINIAATDLRAFLNRKKVGRFSPNTKKRKVWIFKQFFVYMDDLESRRIVFTIRERKKEWKVSISFI